MGNEQSSSRPPAHDGAREGKKRQCDESKHRSVLIGGKIRTPLTERLDYHEPGPGIANVRHRCDEIAEPNNDSIDPVTDGPDKVYTLVIRDRKRVLKSQATMRGNSTDRTPKPGESSDSEKRGTHESGEMRTTTLESGHQELSRVELIESVRNRCGETEGAESCEVVGHIEDQLVKVYDSTEGKRYIASAEDLEKKILFMSEMSNLYAQDTLEAHQQIVKRIHEENCAADQVYDEIHRSGELELSDFENVQPSAFVKRLVEEGHIKDGQLILELGPGGGADLCYIAEKLKETRCGGIDISELAVKGARKNAMRKGLQDRVGFTHGNFLDVLANCDGQPIGGVLTVSTSQYQPGQVLEHEQFPIMGRILSREGGKLCIAIKDESSDSAHSPYQIELAPGHPDNPKMDLRGGGLLRVYLAGLERQRQLMSRSGLKPVDERIVSRVGYDRKRQTERFIQSVWESA